MQPKPDEQGFSYIDVIIAMLILLIGVLGATSALMANVVRSYEIEKQIVAKQVAISTIESIFSAREIVRPTGATTPNGGINSWDSIGNVGSNPVNGTAQGIFLNGWCPIRQEEGADGAAGTADDACPAGNNCQVNGGAINSSVVIPGYERQIVITDLQDSERPSPPHAISRRRIDVTVRYQINQLRRSQTVSTIVANY